MHSEIRFQSGCHERKLLSVEPLSSTRIVPTD